MRLSIFSNQNLPKAGTYRVKPVFCLVPLWCDDTESYHWLEYIYSFQRFTRFSMGANKHDSGHWNTISRHITLEFAENVKKSWVE